MAEQESNPKTLPLTPVRLSEEERAWLTRIVPTVFAEWVVWVGTLFRQVGDGGDMQLFGLVLARALNDDKRHRSHDRQRDRSRW